MRVLIYTRSDAMGWVRCLWPGAVLQAAGHEILMVDANKPNSPIIFEPDGRGGAKNVTALPGVDVVVLQRVTQRTVFDAMRIWQANGVRVVIDMDDNLRDVNPLQNPGAYGMLNDKPAELSWKITEQAIEAADGVVVSTQALKDYYGGTIIRNCVPGRYLEIGKDAPDVRGVVRWSGAAALRQRDGAVIGATLARLQRDGYELHVAGRPDLLDTVFNLDRPPAQAQVTDLFQYPYVMAASTVGIVPLAHNKFNLAKSWLKPLQFALLGVPCVVSPLYEYELLGKSIPAIQYANNPRQWYAKTSQLLADPEHRAFLSEWGRQQAQQFTYEANAHLWWKAWTGDSIDPTATPLVHTR